MSILLMALSFSGWLALKAEKQSTLKETNQRGEDISRFVAKSLSFSVIGYDYHTIDLLLNEITTSSEIGFAKVINKKGNTMAEFGARSDDLLVFEEPIIIDGEVIGHLYLGLSAKLSLNRLENQKYTLIKREAFIILLIAIGEFLALSYIIVRPVSIISESLENQHQEDGQIIGNIPVMSNDEFGELARRFNKLSENLNDANATLRSRADLADKQLVITNELLQKQSDDLKIMNEEFKKLSITDPLTGLYNRRHFDHALNTEIGVTQRYGDINSLIIIDIDNFKQINDTYGHEAGDVVIKEISDVMSKGIRKTDLLCRVGGEEFACLCKRSDKTVGVEIAEKLRKSVESHNIVIGNDKICVTISSGVATITGENFDSHSRNLYRFSDQALYQSKQTGRNKVTHYDDINT